MYNPDPYNKRYTSLAWAAVLGHEETFEFLLSSGHDDHEYSKVCILVLSLLRLRPFEAISRCSGLGEKSTVYSVCSPTPVRHFQVVPHIHIPVIEQCQYSGCIRAASDSDRPSYMIYIQPR